MTKERAKLGVNFGFSKLIEVSEELKNVGSAAPRERQWWPVIFQVLSEGVPIPALLILVSA